MFVNNETEGTKVLQRVKFNAIVVRKFVWK